MIWAIVGSRSCFCWLYRTFPSWLQLIQSMLFQYWPSSDVHVELALVLLEEGVCYDQCALNIVYVRSTCSPWDELAVQLFSTGTAIVELSWNGEDKKLRVIQFISVTQSCLTLRLHGLQHARPPCPSPTPGVYSNSCPWSRWCHPTISSSVVPFSSCLQSFPASRSFPMSQFFASGSQSIGVSASASVLQMNIQDWFPLGWIGWISLLSEELSRVFSNTTVPKHQFLGTQFSL